MPSVKTIDNGMTLDPAARLAVSDHAPAEWLPLITLSMRGQQWATPLGIAETPVCARVDAGRWIAECDGCGTASWVTPTDPRLWCTECENARLMGRWVPVLFPPDREEGERILSVRLPKDQFWFPDRETTIDLMGENVGQLNLPPFEGY